MAPRPAARLADAARAAAADAAAAPPARRLHDARVAAKRLRACWRLLRPALGAEAARRRRRELARAARVLSDARDLESQRALALRLARAERGPLAAPLRALVRRLPPPAGPASLAGPLRTLTGLLASSSSALAGAAGRARDADLLRGLRRLERRLEEARARAGKEAAPAASHECRKRAKDLQYALEALRTDSARARACARAGEKLGLGRDLARLAGHADGPLARELSRRAARRLRAGLDALP